MVVVAEYEPTDTTWAELLAAEEIVPTWPEGFSEFLDGLGSD